MQKTKTKALKFVSRNRAVVDLNRHSDIMEDVIDRIKVKEAMLSGKFIDWEKAKKSLQKHTVLMAYQIVMQLWKAKHAN